MDNPHNSNIRQSFSTLADIGRRYCGHHLLKNRINILIYHILFFIKKSYPQSYPILFHAAHCAGVSHSRGHGLP
jgi:hypothetical protein